MKKLFNSLVLIIIFGGIAAVGYMFFKDMDSPTIIMEPDTGSVSPTQDIILHLEDIKSGVRSVSVSVRKGTQSVVVFEQIFPNVPPKVSVRFNLKTSRVRDGQIDLEIRATDASFGWGNAVVRTYSVTVDGIPPRIMIISPPGASSRKGSAASVSYTLSKKVLRTGVQVGDEFFPAYQQPGGEYFCLLAFPITMSLQQFVPEIVARDLAGNEARSRLLLPAQDRKYRNDTLKIDDAFLESAMPAFMELIPDAPNHLERYIRVNNEVRLANETTLREIAKQTAPVSLWSGAFMRLPGSALKAAFGDFRTYKYGEQIIDYQTHMGQDMASVRHAPIPAANSGKVVFAGELGIFGKLVVIDHGLGLMSLYAHMSNIETSIGNDIKRGETLGATGTTGLAGGDHLHFGILVNGIQVQPLDWFDSNWIKNNITGRLVKK